MKERAHNRGKTKQLTKQSCYHATGTKSYHTLCCHGKLHSNALEWVDSHNYKRSYPFEALTFSFVHFRVCCTLMFSILVYF